MEQENSTKFSEFIFLSFSQKWEIQLIFFFFFLTFYIIVLLGNLLIIISVWSDPHLNSPMYFFLANLAFLDICYCSITSPKMLVDFFSSCKTISYNACMAQIFFIHFLGSSEILLLIDMAFDRYMAICQPLHYTSLVNRKLCWSLVVVAWAAGLVHAIILTNSIVKLPFCSQNVLDSFYCDIPQVLALACVNIYAVGILTFGNNVGIILPCFFLLMASYCFLLFKLRNSSLKERKKVTSSCITHMTVIVFMFCPAIYIYWYPFRSASVDKAVTVLHTLIFPLTNPVIYTLRNKEVASSMKRMVHKCFTLGRQKQHLGSTQLGCSKKTAVVPSTQGSFRSIFLIQKLSITQETHNLWKLREY